MEAQEIVAIAARLVVEEGLDYGAAKRRAVRQLGLRSRTPLPDHAALDQAVQEYLQVFCADTQPAELRVLRELALQWMQRLAPFRPHLGGAVWHGTATRNSDVYLQLFCDDEKSAEIALIDLGVPYQAQTVTGLHGQPVEALSLWVPCSALGETVGVHLLINDLDDLRGALHRDALGRRPRGDINAVRELLNAD